MTSQTNDPNQTEASANGPSRRDLARVGAGAALIAAAGVGAARAQSNDAAAADRLTGQLAGKVAFVTGAARGIGRAIAVEYAREGADVALFDITAPIEEVNYPLGTPEELEETRAMVEREGRAAITIQGDQRDGDAMRAAVQRTIDELDGLDVMVPNAGITVWGRPLAQLTEDEIRTVLDVNLMGTFHAIQAVIPHMTERGEGRIVTMSSMMGRRGVPAVAPYDASKWAIIGLSKSAAIELGPSGIKVNCITPGAVDTPLNRNQASYDWIAAQGGEATLEGYVEVLTQSSPLGVPWSQPIDVARAAVYLASPATAEVTGTVMTVDVGSNATANAV